jgi:cytochrome c oxidase subunit 1
MPLGAAFFNFIIPLQIGARDVAFPRMNAFSYWVFLLGGILLNLGWLGGAAPDVGWFAYAPLTLSEYSPGNGMEFYVLGLLVLGISSLAAAFNFIVTILNMRAPGMTLLRMPMFTWMTLLVAILLVLAFPVLTVGLIELLFSRFWGMPFFNAREGGDPILWQHIFWVFGHPEVYILILPAMGIVSDVLPTFARKPLFGYPVIVFSGISLAFLGFAVWAHHMFTVGLGPMAVAVFAGSTMVIAVPTGVKVFSWMATLWGGSLNFKTPMLFAIGFIALFVIGGLSGIMHASPPVDTQHQDTYFIVAHIHYVLFGGSVFGLFAGVYYWFPKVTGRLLGEGLGKLNFWLMFIGMNVTFGPMHLVGLLGMPRRIYTYPEGMGWTFLNQLETIGAFILGLGILIFLINFFRSLRHGEIAGDDPWDGRTLEWTIPSPPPEYNFAVIPEVHSREPLWDRKHPELTQAVTPSISGGANGEPVDVGAIHMPNASLWPVVTAIGVGLGGGLIIINPLLGAVGAVITIVGVFGWALEPAGPEGH